MISFPVICFYDLEDKSFSSINKQFLLLLKDYSIFLFLHFFQTT